MRRSPLRNLYRDVRDVFDKNVCRRSDGNKYQRLLVNRQLGTCTSRSATTHGAVAQTVQTCQASENDTPSLKGSAVASDMNVFASQSMNLYQQPTASGEALYSYSWLVNKP